MHLFVLDVAANQRANGEEWVQEFNEGLAEGAAEWGQDQLNDARETSQAINGAMRQFADDPSGTMERAGEAMADAASSAAGSAGGFLQDLWNDPLGKSQEVAIRSYLWGHQQFANARDSAVDFYNAPPREKGKSTAKLGAEAAKDYAIGKSLKLLKAGFGGFKPGSVPSVVVDPRKRGGYDPGAIHDDHPIARSLGGDPEVTRPFPAASNLRKGGLEGELRRYEDYLIRNGLEPEQAREVIQAEIESLARDAIASPYGRVFPGGELPNAD